jgi:hypothetical protein
MEPKGTCPCRKLNPYVLMMQSPKYGSTFDAPDALNDPSNRRILTQREMRTDRVVILHIAQEDVAKVLLACHHNMIQAFSPDRADQSLRTAILPR